MQQGFIKGFSGLTGRGRAVAFGVLAGAAVVMLSGPSMAQAEGARAWGKGTCSDCHSGIAQGGGVGENPDGPSIRETELDRETLRETIACGRIGSDMPFNLAGAYRVTPCWGLPLGDPPAGTISGAQLSEEDLDVLVDFLFEYVIGVTTINRAACAVFYGGNVDSPACARYPR